LRLQLFSFGGYGLALAALALMTATQNLNRRYQITLRASIFLRMILHLKTSASSNQSRIHNTKFINPEVQINKIGRVGHSLRASANN